MTSIEGKAPLTKTLINTQRARDAHRRRVAYHPVLSNPWMLSSMRLRVKSATKNETEVSAAVQPITVSQPMQRVRIRQEISEFIHSNIPVM